MNLNKKNGHNTFFSIDCISKNRRTGRYVECLECGKSIYRQKCLSGNFYCSNHCSTVFNNRNFTGAIAKNYKEGKSSYRDFALRTLPNECSYCGYDTLSILEVHHKDANRRNNKIENLDILCPTHPKEYQQGIL